MRLPALLACAAFGACASPSPGEKPVRVEPNQLALLMGGRQFGDDDVWAPVEDEFAGGLEYSRVGASGLGWELGLSASGRFDVPVSSGVNATGLLAEMYTGIRKEFRIGDWRPYFGAGGVILAAGIDNDSAGAIVDDEDASAAYYFRGGLLLDVTPGLTLGMDARVVQGSSLEFDTIDGDADYGQLALVIATSF